MSSRRGASKQTKALEATARLRELREGGKRRLDEVDADADKIEDVYDELDESAYRALVQKRREAAADFVVNDDGEGYEDLGEEEDWTEANPNYSDDDEYDADGRKVAKAPAEEEPKRAKMDKMEKARLANAKAKDKASSLAGGAAKKKKKLDEVAEEADADAMLDDILNGVDVFMGAVAPAPAYRAVPPPAPRVVAPPVAVTEPRRSPRKAAAIVAATRVAPAKSQTPPSAKKSVTFDVEAAVNNDDDDMPTGDYGAFNDDDGDVPVAMEEETFKPKPAKSATKMDMDVKLTNLEERTLNTVSSLKTLDDEDSLMKDSGPVTQDNAPVTFNGTELPQDADGSMPFFFMDAHEDREWPGLVFLFGRVPVSNEPDAQTVSACAVVQNMQRCMFVIPTPDTFNDPDGALEDLGRAMEETRRDSRMNPEDEEKKTAAAESKKALMKALIPKSAALREEFKDVLKTRKIENFKISLVRRHYCFERKDIPHGPMFALKVQIPGTTTALPSDLKGKNFIAVMGTQAPMLELLTLKSKLQGPSWISLHGATIVSDNQKSWCKLELALPLAHKGVRPQSSKVALRRDSPRLTVASLTLQTIVNQQTNVNEIAVASVEYLRDVSCDGATSKEEVFKGMRHFTVVRKLDGLDMPANWPQVVSNENATNSIAKRTGSVVLASQTSELGLLNFLLAKLNQLDPDVIVGHNIGGFNLDVLLRRFQANKIGHWSRIGRMQRKKMPNINGTGGAYGGGASIGALQCLAGRLLADTYLSAKDILNKEVSYTLSSLSETQLGVRRLEVPSDDIPKHYQDSNALMHLVRCTEQDAKLSLHLMFKMEVIPLTKQLSNIAGNMWSKTLGHTRAQRVEYLLLHEFHSRKYIVPDRLSAKERRRVDAVSGVDEDEDEGKKGPSYAGGLVLEPKKGLYDTYVLVLDYQSLYPSIIQEYNICYTTVKRHFAAGEEANVELPQAVNDDNDFAVLPSVIKKIVESRKVVKALMKNENDAGRNKQYDLRQLALKLTANSMYGCLGFSASRFHAEPIAALITSQGRNILQRTVDLARSKCEMDVIYGDTDSIMVNTMKNDYALARADGAKLIRFVNREYRKLVLEEDYAFKAMLLLKKKKYAAIKVVQGPNKTYVTKLEMKGLDIVRRDWCPLVKEIGEECLKELLECDEDIEERVSNIHESLLKVREDMIENRVHINKYVITKQLTKSVNEYPDAKNQAHVMVAKRRLEAGKQDGVKAGETVPYIIALDSDMSLADIADGKAGSSGGKGLADRAYHPEEVIERGLKVDLHYYLSQQLHPVISRLCAPIEETDGAKIAECLGLDSNKFKAQLRAADDDFDDSFSGGSFALEDEERFKYCKPLELRAHDGSLFNFCGVRQVLDGKVSADAALAPSTPGTDDKENTRMSSTAQEKDNARKVSPAAFANQVRLAVREHIREYYAAPLRSDDDVDASRTRNIALRVHHTDENLTGTLNADPLSKGTMQKTFREEDLYNQLLYYKRLLSTDDALRIEKDKTVRDAKHGKIRGTPLEAALSKAYDALNSVMDKCSYRWISLAELFAAAKSTSA